MPRTPSKARGFPDALRSLSGSVRAGHILTEEHMRKLQQEAKMLSSEKIFSRIISSIHTQHSTLKEGLYSVIQLLRLEGLRPCSCCQSHLQGHNYSLQSLRRSSSCLVRIYMHSETPRPMDERQSYVRPVRYNIVSCSGYFRRKGLRHSSGSGKFSLLQRRERLHI